MVILQTWLAETVDVVSFGRAWASYCYALYARCICSVQRFLGKTAIGMCCGACIWPDMVLLLVFAVQDDRPTWRKGRVVRAEVVRFEE